MHLNPDQPIPIPRRIAMIPEFCCYSCRQLLFVTFGHDSQLKEIGPSAVADARVKLLGLPNSLSPIQATAWYNSCIESLLIDTGNQPLVTEPSMLFSPDQRVLIKSLRRPIASSKTLTSIGFEMPSQTRRCEAFTFSQSTLVRIHVRASVEVLGDPCFADGSALQSMTFQSDIRSHTIEESGFDGASLT
jgi:hypothetical protein